MAYKDSEEYTKDKQRYKKQFGELYNLIKETERLGIEIPKEPEYKPDEEKAREIVSREAMPRIDEAKIEPLKIVEPEIIGEIFDRVKFLEQRISELQELLATREKLHRQIVREIDADVKDRGDMVAILSDINERRNLKLDISILRKEKRHESVQFWKDIVEVRSELRNLLEQYETEKKIVGVFNRMKGVDND